MQLTQIFIYPIKSLAGISLPACELTPRGLALDRRWMLVDPAGNFFTQRTLPKMARLFPKISADSLFVYASDRKDLEPLAIPVQAGHGHEKMQVRIWNDQVEAWRLHRDCDQWFSEALGVACRLVYMPDSTHRPVDPRYAAPQEMVSFADGYPFLVVGESSLQALNDRLETPVDIRRFRPNLVFSGGAAFTEDNWNRFQIGQWSFRGAKPCARCKIIGIDPVTTEYSFEPTRTLNTFRRVGNDVLFGLNACWEFEKEIGSQPVLRVGDAVSPDY